MKLYCLTSFVDEIVVYLHMHVTVYILTLKNYIPFRIVKK